MIEPGKLLVLVGSPRRAGNSATLAKAVQRGAKAAGAQVSLRFVDDFILSFLRDCHSCRLPSGSILSGAGEFGFESSCRGRSKNMSVKFREKEMRF
jgi:hypothetical protein